MRLVFLVIFFMMMQSVYAEICTYHFHNDNNEMIKKDYNTDDVFGCEHENRDIKKYQNKAITLSLMLNNKFDRLLKVIKGSKPILFDIYSFSDPDTDKVREVVFFKNKNLLLLLYGYNAFVSGENDAVEVDASFYKVSLYKLYNNFPLKINFDLEQLTGIDGFYHGKYLKYKYKHRDTLKKEINKLSLDKKMIISSLESFLSNVYKGENTSRRIYEEGSINIAFLKEFIDDIALNKGSLESYNNIAYYLQKLEANEEAVYLLEKVIEESPERIVAYYNLADAYWEIKSKKKSVILYEKYIKMMKEKGLENKIPKDIYKKIAIKELESAPQKKPSKLKKTAETTKQTPVTTPHKNVEVIKGEKAEPLEQSASGSISLTLLASFLGLLAWRVS